MMHALKMPEPLAGVCVQGKQGVGKQIVAYAVMTIEVEHGRSGRHVDNSPLSVQRHAGPARGSFRPLGYQSRDLGLFQDTDGAGYLLTEDRASGLRIDAA